MLALVGMSFQLAITDSISLAGVGETLSSRSVWLTSRWKAIRQRDFGCRRSATNIPHLMFDARA